MGEQPHPVPPPRHVGPGGDSRSPLGALAQRLRGLSTTTKVIYAGAAVFILAVVIIAATGAAAGRPKSTPPPLAKNFTLTELGDPGHTVSLTQYAGRPVIVNFFASWCTPCKHETPLMASFYKRMAGKVVVIGIDADDKASNALKFMRKAGVSYPVGFDPYPSVTDSYGVVGIPQTFFLDAQHRIVKHVYGAVTLKELTQGVALMDSRHQQADAAAQTNQDRG
jgi:cytochrome c biogenesis protein CcmG, thiol:disulfide interchange protein DsbE